MGHRSERRNDVRTAGPRLRGAAETRGDGALVSKIHELERELDSLRMKVERHAVGKGGVRMEGEEGSEDESGEESWEESEDGGDEEGGDVEEEIRDVELLRAKLAEIETALPRKPAFRISRAKSGIDAAMLGSSSSSSSSAASKASSKSSSKSGGGAKTPSGTRSIQRAKSEATGLLENLGSSSLAQGSGGDDDENFDLDRQETVTLQGLQAFAQIQAMEEAEAARKGKKDGARNGGRGSEKEWDQPETVRQRPKTVARERLRTSSDDGRSGEGRESGEGRLSGEGRTGRQGKALSLKQVAQMEGQRTRLKDASMAKKRAEEDRALQESGNWSPPQQYRIGKDTEWDGDEGYLRQQQQRRQQQLRQQWQHRDAPHHHQQVGAGERPQSTGEERSCIRVRRGKVGGLSLSDAHSKSQGTSSFSSGSSSGSGGSSGSRSGSGGRSGGRSGSGGGSSSSSSGAAIARSPLSRMSPQSDGVSPRSVDGDLQSEMPEVANAMLRHSDVSGENLEEVGEESKLEPENVLKDHNAKAGDTNGSAGAEIIQPEERQRGMAGGWGTFEPSFADSTDGAVVKGAAKTVGRKQQKSGVLRTGSLQVKGARGERGGTRESLASVVDAMRREGERLEEMEGGKGGGGEGGGEGEVRIQLSEGIEASKQGGLARQSSEGVDVMHHRGVRRCSSGSTAVDSLVSSHGANQNQRQSRNHMWENAATEGNVLPRQGSASILQRLSSGESLGGGGGTMRAGALTARAKLAKHGGSLKMTSREKQQLLEELERREQAMPSASPGPGYQRIASPLLTREEFLARRAEKNRPPAAQAVSDAGSGGKSQLPPVNAGRLPSPADVAGGAGGKGRKGGVANLAERPSSGQGISSSESPSPSRPFQEEKRRSSGRGIPRPNTASASGLERTSSDSAFKPATPAKLPSGRVFRKVFSNPPDIHDPPIPKREGSAEGRRASREEAVGDGIHMNMAVLVDALNFGTVDERRSAAKQIRVMIKGSTENKNALVDEKGVEPLVELLLVEDEESVDHALSSLMNLCLNGDLAGEVVKAGGIPAIVHVLGMGGATAKGYAAAALFGISKSDDFKLMVRAAGAIPKLVELLSTGSSRAQKDSSLALFTLSTNPKCSRDIVKFGTVKVLMEKIEASVAGMEEKATAVLSNLARSNEGCKAIMEMDAMTKFVDLLDEGSTLRVKEDAAATLLHLACRGFVSYDQLLAEGVLPSLVQISQLRKGNTEANMLLDILRKHCAKRSSRV